MGAAGPTGFPGETSKLISLALEEFDGLIAESLAEMERLPFVDSLLALPDVHQKAQMEIPSSIAVTTRDVIVPEFTSAAVNDGMGIVVTDLDSKDLTAERVRAFFTRVNSHSAAHPFDDNRYSISEEELRHVIVEGARGVLERYRLPERTLAAMEDEGKVPDAAGGAIEDIVPIHLLATRFGRCEMGLNFGGNHFLEIQAVDRIVDDAGRRWGLHEGQVVVMYHLGPGPFSGTLLHHYSRRSKLKPHRVPMFFLSKLFFHYVQRFGRANPMRAWELHFRHNRWTPYAIASSEGQRFRRALAMALNFGYAYRLGTVRAIMDGVAETFGPGTRAELFCDIAHNGVTEETWGGRRGWVARHNACRLSPGQPAIVAGSYDVPSYLGIGGDAGDAGMHSYDHGAGNLIEQCRDAGQLAEDEGSVTRIRMTRGRNAAIVRLDEVPIRTREPIDRVMECLAAHRVVRPVARLRPIGNFKN